IKPELLRERRRQVDHLVLPADRDSHVRPGRRAARPRAAGARGDTEQGDERAGSPEGLRYGRFATHSYCFHWSSHRSRRLTAALTITTTMPSTVMPAKTPV